MKAIAHRFRPVIALWMMILVAGWVAAIPMPARAQGDQIVYDDALQNGWQDWGWATHDYANASPVYSGNRSVAVTAGAWQALYLHHEPFDTRTYASLSFRIHGGSTGGQRLQVQAVLGGSAQPGVAIPTPAAGTWSLVNLPLSQLGAANAGNMDGFWIQDVSGSGAATFYIDDIRLIASTTPPPPNEAVTVNIDVAANRRPINPLIYGQNYAGDNLSALNAPIHRIGGNNLTRYNWRLNADNRGADWFFQSIGDNDATPGGRINAFVSANKAAGVQSMVTVPTLGWVADLGANRAKKWSFSVQKYGAQQRTDQWNPDSGNGIRPDGSLITGNDPRDANVPSSPAFMSEWILGLTGSFGTAANGGVGYYILDNEPSIWHSTHRDVFPTGATMEQVYTRMRDYAAMIKGIDPGAQVVGPEEWGWSGYLYSGYDLQWGAANGWSNLPDRAAHGGMDYVAWILDQFRRDEQARGARLLDVFSLHYYPQGGEFSDDTSPAMQLRRNRSTRSLWDPNYTDESWIAAPVQLVPRMKQWVSQYYPGTRIALTEYNWGADAHINGATTQADILGILGREGMDIATRWTSPAPETPTFKAFQMYRNYDGNRGAFGDVSVAATVPNPDTLSAFASQDSATGAVKVMVINKALSGSTPVTLNVANFTPAGTAQAYQLTSANAINRLPDVTLTSGKLIQTVPAQSITLYVLPRQAAAQPARVEVSAVSLVQETKQIVNIKTLDGLTATITLKNTGASTAQSVRLTDVRLNGVAPLTTLPLAVGPIAPGASATATVRFAQQTGRKTWNVTTQGDFTGGTFSGSNNVTLTSAPTGGGHGKRR